MKTSLVVGSLVRPGKILAALFSVVATVLCTVHPLSAANIVFVSDNTGTGFAGPIANTADDYWVTNLLQTAGHNVVRFSSDNANTNLLTQAQIDGLNTNDLVIISRSTGSGAFQAPQGNQWNTNITKPMILMSAYLMRNSRMGWLSGNDDVPDGAPGPLRLADPADPVTSYLFTGVTLNDDVMADPFDFAVDRNISLSLQPLVAGGRVIARSVNGTVGPVIAEWPEGTAVKGGADILAGYRMFFGGGSREPSGGSVPQAGANNLTQVGQEIFMRAVDLALNNGVPPNIVQEPILIATDPESRTVNEGQSVTFSVTLSQGTQPRFQWYFNDAPIPGANTLAYNISAVVPDQAGDYYVSISNSLGVVNSEVATLTVNADVVPPTVLTAYASPGDSLNSFIVFFSEPVLAGAGPNGAEDPNLYYIEKPDGSDTHFPVSATLVGRTTVILQIASDLEVGADYQVGVFNVGDRSAQTNTLPDYPGLTIPLQRIRGSGNIVWVSDNSAVGFSEAVAGSFDDAFVTNMLQAAGYNVIRFNSDDAAATLLTPEQIDALNTNDLIIVGRATASAAFTPGQGSQWNTNITVPMMVMSSYLVRSGNLAWFTGGDVPDDTETRLVSTNLTRPEVSYLFDGVALDGNMTYDNYDELLDRNTSMINSAPVDGGVIIANAVQNGGVAIAGFPEGTLVRSGTETLAGYRMFFAGGSREAASPVSNAGKDNLTPLGEYLFLRAVEIAINDGQPPGGGPGPEQPIVNPSFVGGTFSAAIQTANGETYGVEYKDDLNSATWTPLTTIAGDGTVKSFSDPGPAVTSRYYRIVRQ